MAGATGGTPAERGAVAMVVRNAVSHDTRVLREAEALMDAGFAVTIFGLLMPDTLEREERNGIAIVRLKPRTLPVRVLEAVSRNTRKTDRRLRALIRKVGRKRRSIAARLRRQWRLLALEGTVAGATRAVKVALPALRTGLVSVPLYPFAVLRALVLRPAPLEDEASALPEASAAPVAPPPPPSKHVSKGIFRRLIVVADRWRLHVTRLEFQRLAGRRMAELRPVAYHCHDFNTLWAGTVARRRWRAPVVYDSHEIHLHRNLVNHSRLSKPVFGRIERHLIRRAAAVITVNDSIAEYLAERYGVPTPVVVRNVPSAGPTIEVAVPEPFERPGPKVLYLGGVTLGRGIEQAIEAMRYLPDATLIIMGPVVREQYRVTFQELADAGGASDRIFIVPAVPPDHIQWIIGRASVGLSVLLNQSLNNYYSLPNKLFSYIQAGVPVVASDFPELRRVVLGYEVGKVCDPEDPKALAQAISSIVDDPEVHARFRDAAASAAQVLTWERESENLVSVYRQLER